MYNVSFTPAVRRGYYGPQLQSNQGPLYPCLETPATEPRFAGVTGFSKSTRLALALLAALCGAGHGVDLYTQSKENQTPLPAARVALEKTQGELVQLSKQVQSSPDGAIKTQYARSLDATFQKYVQEQIPAEIQRVYPNGQTAQAPPVIFTNNPSKQAAFNGLLAEAQKGDFKQIGKFTDRAVDIAVQGENLSPEVVQGLKDEARQFATRIEKSQKTPNQGKLILMTTVDAALSLLWLTSIALDKKQKPAPQQQTP
jgi:hypothetical protein